MSGTSENPFTADIEAWSQRIVQGAQALAQIGKVEVGCSPKDAIYREDKVVVYRYRALSESSAAKRIRTPLLICYALVNRPYMMDLQPDRSLIRGLLTRGVDVYLIDWGYPDGADRYLELKDYVLRYLPHCVEAVRVDAAHSAVNLLGVCQGGTLSLCYAAAFPQHVRNLITMVTPVDFCTPENLLTKWSEGVDIDALVSTLGNVPGEMLNALFLAQMPYRLATQKYVSVLERAEDRIALENFLRMEQWIFDSPDQAGETFRQFMHAFVKQNRLVTGGLQIAGRSIELRNIRVPILNVYAQRDHLVPPSSSRALQRLVASDDYSEHEFHGGHIGIYVSAAAQREIPGRIAEWLRARDGRERRTADGGQ